MLNILCIAHVYQHHASAGGQFVPEGIICSVNHFGWVFLCWIVQWLDHAKGVACEAVYVYFTRPEHLVPHTNKAFALAIVWIVLRWVLSVILLLPLYGLFWDGVCL